MGCGTSLPVKGGEGETVGEQKGAGPAPQRRQSHGYARTSDFSDGGDAFKQLPPLGFSGKVMEDQASSVQSMNTGSERGVVSTPSLLSSRQSLIAGSGSLGSKFSRSNILPEGWTLGAGVLLYDDRRTSHINSLACTIMKVPVVAFLMQSRGRMSLSCSKGVPELGEITWLPEFCQWVFGQELLTPLVIENALQDDRCSECSWVSSGPRVRFIALSAVQSLDGERLATLCALDPEPHAAVASCSMMLSNLGNMAARELDGPPVAPGPASQYVVGGIVLSAEVREKMDAYGWGTMLLVVRDGRWSILYANEAFRTVIGIPPGCLEGHGLWDFFEPMATLELPPAEAHDASIAARSAFMLPPLLLRGQLPSTTALCTKQLFKVEMRPFDEENAATFDVRPPKEADQWFAGFLPDARLSLDAARPPPGGEADEEGATPFPSLELGPVIGKGSYGYVCRGALGYLIVAVKIIEAESFFRMDSEGNLLEASLAKNLRHPNVCQILDYTLRQRKVRSGSRAGSFRQPDSIQGGSLATAPRISPASPDVMSGSSKSLLTGLDEDNSIVEAWLILEYCDLGTLMEGIGRDWFGEKAAPGETERQVHLRHVLLTAFEIASAMRYLHRHNILHGDLTAGNVLLASSRTTTTDQRGFTAKVADFGLSREALTSKVETNSYGTVTHMPPELLNDGVLSKHADVYAFGVLLVEMYTGARAFAGMRHPQVIHNIAVLRKYPQMPATAPDWLQDLVRGCVQEEYKQRPPFEQIMGLLAPHIGNRR